MEAARPYFDTPLAELPGFGPKRADVLAKTGIVTARDLLHFYPRRYLDRSTTTLVADLRPDGPAVTIVGTVRAMNTVVGGKMRFELLLEDERGGTIKGVWFHGVQWISRSFKKGERLAFHGKPQAFGSTWSLTHPDFDRLDADGPALDTGRIIPLYPGGQAFDRAGLSNRILRRLLYTLFKEHGLEIEADPMPPEIVQRYRLLDARVALRAVHFPKSADELDAARRRLKFDELFHLQLLLALTKGAREHVPGAVLSVEKGPLLQSFLTDVLPFRFTGAQDRALDDVLADVSSGRQMNRLVQGDVGSGKTVVAVAAMLHAVDHGYQGAFLAPTEILSEQHAANLARYLEPLGLQHRLLLGGQRKKLRAEYLDDLANGRAQIAVGTHALLEETVVFQNLGLAVVDEQHRFGVMQRAAMFAKGERPHMLLMTATPIPRSLALTLYGDLDVTVMNERPAGRKPIQTRVFSEKRRGEVMEFLKHQLREGRQAYVVYPLVEESEKLDLKDAVSGYEQLQAELRPYKVDLVHGQMFAYEKDEAMQRFKSGETDVLVATTVIEVGVDVPNATVMLIEHAERFGLSQLHQLRGRVGRGGEQSYCLLMADVKRTREAEERLEIMADTDDGFRISEFDLRQRGAGDFFGTRQSGLPDLKIADVVQDLDVLQQAREAAFALAAADPRLSHPQHAAIRTAFQRATKGKGLGYAQVG